MLATIAELSAQNGPRGVRITTFVNGDVHIMLGEELKGCGPTLRAAIRAAMEGGRWKNHLEKPYSTRR